MDIPNPTSKLANIFGGSLLDGVKGIIAEFKLSPEDKAKLQMQMEENADAFTNAENNYNAKLNDIASANIRAEAATGDKYTERARPSVIYWGLAAFTWNFCLVPTLGIFKVQIPPLPIPDIIVDAWKIVVTGYVFGRSLDKFMALPGASQIKLPFGIQMGNNSPATPQ